MACAIPVPIIETPLYTRLEAAAYCKISVSQLDAMAREGKVRRIKLGTGQRSRVLYRKCDLDACLLAHLSSDSAE